MAGRDRPDVRSLDDPLRIAAVRRLLAADPASEGVDRLTRLATRLTGAGHAHVVLLGDRHVVVSTAGAHGCADERNGRAEQTLCALAAAAGRSVAISDASTHPWTASLPAVAGGDVAAYLGVPVRDRAGFVLGALCAYDSEPLEWDADDIEILAELADSVVAGLELAVVSSELATSAARFDLALDAADIGNFDLEIDTGVLTWDRRLIELFGYDPDTFVPHLDSFFERVHPDDHERVAAAIQRTVDAAADFSMEYRIVLPDGRGRWVAARGRLVGVGPTGSRHLLGAAYDSTELRTSRDRLARVLETMTDAFFSVDTEWRFTYVNARAEQVLLRPRDELLGRNVWEEFPDAVGAAFDVEYHRAMETGERVSFEEYYPDPLDMWFEVTAWPSPDGLSVYFHDVTGRRRADEERERVVAEREEAVLARERSANEAAAANARLTLLADATSRLTSSLEPEEVLATLADLLVPHLATWVAVAVRADIDVVLLGQDVVADPDRVRVVHTAHADPGQGASLMEFLQQLRLSVRDPAGVGKVVGTGVPEYLSGIPDDVLVDLSEGDDGRLDTMRHLRLRSALTVPMSSRNRVLGALTLGDPVHGDADQELAVELARRAAVALDNALLYRRERSTALTLQRSLLPGDVPHLPDVDIAVRYIPGTSGAYIGGDFYSGVLVDGRLALALGDVMGHGMLSAARMGQLRAIVTALALEGHRPAELLSRLAANAGAMLDLELATLLVCLYDPADRTLAVASAGHPAPLVAPIGVPPFYVDVDPGPPLGAPTAEYTEALLELPAGSTLVLYSDGLVENRDESITTGLERLRQAVDDLRLPPQAVCDHVLRVLGRTKGSDDDVALLVVHHEADAGKG